MRTLPQSTPSSEGPTNNIVQPTLYPRTVISRIVTGLYDVNNDGVNPSLEAINFSLNDVPGYSELTAVINHIV